MKIQIFLMLIVMILHTNALSEQKDQNLIQTTCKNTPNYQLCTAILRSNRQSATADVAGLALIMVDAVKAKSKEAISIVYKLMKSGNRRLSQEALQQCADAYNGVLKGDVPEAVEALTKGDPKFGENGMADAAVEADSCDRAFGARSPLSGVNGAVHNRAVVARAIIRNLL